MRAFVTGATGFVGSHLVRELAGRGVVVSCLVRNEAKASRVLAGMTYEPIRGNLEDQRALEDGCADADIVFHVAGAVTARSEREFHSINVEATTRLLHAAERSGGIERLVYVSSLAAAGPSTVDRAHGDASGGVPITHYGRSKLAGENEVRGTDLPWTIVRPPTVYGPRDVELFKVFQLAKLRIAPLFGTGAQRLSLVYVEDLAVALVTAALATPPRRAYYACHPEIVTARELAIGIYRATTESTGTPIVLPVPRPIAMGVLALTQGMASLAGRATLLTLDKGAEFFAPAWTCTAEALKADSGWKAATGLAEGLSKTADWYRENGWL
ncbi:MAG: NAD-dependent epimerase/dehydratase family protein [Gemmatimonadales bacterium]